MQKKLINMLTIILIVLTSIAYSGLSTSVSITGEAKFRIKADIRVTDIRLKSASNASTRYESEFTKDTITSGFNLSNTSGSISYEVDITNKGEIDAAAYDLLTTSTNNNGVNITISYVDDNNVTHTNEPISTALPIIVPFQTTKTITVTYTSTVAGNVDIINTFDFRTVYYIKYVDASAPTVDIIPKTVKYENVNTTISSTTPTKAGYSFLGWTDLQAAEEAKSSFAPGATYTANQSKILYAVWSGTLCKRASALHHESCGYTSGSTGCYADGYYKGGEKNTTEIYYGTLGQKVNNENVLTSGDAFVCDVNGDGTYNETNEMFYYVSDYFNPNTNSIDNTYAALIYYKDTSTGTVAYDSSNENWHGPQTAVSSLPTTDAWDNISLKENQRQLYAWDPSDDTISTTTLGGTLGKFNYSGKAARLLTFYEEKIGCPDINTIVEGNISKCNYLMENTYYSKSENKSLGHWLETAYTPTSNQIYVNYSPLRFFANDVSNHTLAYFVRPTIDVPKAGMDLTVRSYLLTFNVNYEDPETENQFKTISAGNAIGELPTPARRGYRFDGWYTDTNYTTQVTTSTKPTSSTTYYAKWSVKTICKRASSLHTETCGYTSGSSDCYGDGYYLGGEKNTTTITYGNLGTNSSTLNSGDAFVCDINGDGTYNETNEKFYYVSDYYDTETGNFNADEAVLIYYKDTSNGAVAYDDSNENWHGPQTAVSSLPATTSWTNVDLKESKRQLYSWDGSSSSYVTTTNDGSNTLGTFSYAGYAGRLLTVKELKAACPNASTTIGSLSNCSYLMENTKYSSSSKSSYGYWLETPHASHSSYVWSVNGYDRSLHDYGSSGGYGARPAIEVPKVSIDKAVRSYLITFNTNGADGGRIENTTKTVSVGNPITSLPTEPKKAGKTFDGWYTAASGGTKITPETIPSASTTYYAHFIDVWAENLEYDPSNTDMNATNAQSALDCIKSLLDNGELPSTCTVTTE